MANKDNLVDFESALKRFGERDLPKAALLLQRKVALQILEGVVMRTPVDTGRARGNWQTTLGDPASGVLPNEDKTGGSTISAGVATVLSAQPFGSIWITNNLPYIVALEEGHSQQQAPMGMLMVTVAGVRQQFGGA